MAQNLEKERLATRIGVIGGIIFIIMFAYSFSFYATGSPQPDPQTGQLYGVEMHGLLYVTKLQAYLFYGGLAVALGCALVSALFFILSRRQ